MQWSNVMRSVHSWMGIIVFPFVFLAGVTGFYLSNEDLFPTSTMFEHIESGEVIWPEKKDPLSLEKAITLANSQWKNGITGKVTKKKINDRNQYILWEKGGNQRIVIDIDNHSYYVKTSDYIKRQYTPDGIHLHTKFYIYNIIEHIHKGRLMHWGAFKVAVDVTSIALVLFAISGVYLWIRPRLKRYFRNRS
ncbi:MAG: PepSY-associated TM helix domain-containing protein [Magnetococcales bacterium]|nr:PepSY-associated TM helix domain-containing protein [Magnetococcales bacterium]